MTCPSPLTAVEQTLQLTGDVLQYPGVVEASHNDMAGRVIRRRIGTRRQVKYFLYVPHTASSNPQLFVSVHGISRNAKQHLKCFVKLAEDYGIVVVAPYFSRKQFAGYQRLGWSYPLRADLAFQEIVADVRSLTGATSKIHLFGYSGGAQFAHRYAMAYPEQIERLVVGAAGWYTFPDEARRYPFGTRMTPRLPDIVFDADRYLRIPIRVIVGGWDIHTDTAINRRRKIDRQQGKSRLERARRWIFEMSQKATARGIASRHELIVLSRCGHDFRRCVREGQLGQHVLEFCFDASTGDAPNSNFRQPDCDQVRATHIVRNGAAIAESIQ